MKALYKVYFFFIVIQLWRNKVVKVVNNYKEVKFVIVDEDEYSYLLVEFGLDDFGEEINIVCYGFDGKKYLMEFMEEWEDDEVEEYIIKMKKGSKEMKQGVCMSILSYYMFK